MTEYTTTVLTDAAQWEPILPAWEALRRQQVEPNLEHHPAWLDVEMGGDEAARKGQVAALFRGPELVGVAPFLSRRWVWSSQIAWRTVARFRLRLVDLMGEGPLAPPEPRLHEALLLAIDRAAEPYDVLFLEGLPVGSTLWDVIRSSPAVRRRFRTWMPVGVTRRHRLDLPPTLEDYLQQFTGKRRKGLRYMRRRLEGAGAVTVDRVTRAEQLPRFLEMVERVSTRTWQARRLGKVFTRTGPEAARLALCARHGWLRSYVLRCGQEPIAFALGLQSDAVFRYEVVGFDPEWSGYSPGNVLLLGIVEDLIAFERPHVLDFGHGEAEYKQQFGNQVHAEANVYLVRRKPTATLAYLAATACASANRSGKRMLGGLDVVRSARRRLRASAVRPRRDGAAEPPKGEP